MKLSTAFKRAYELVASGQKKYSCDAILDANGGKAPGALLFYREHFTPAVDSPEHYWLRHIDMTDEEKHEWRLTALAFAAAMAQYDEKHYPSWICAACGPKYGRPMPKGHIATWHIGDACGWCGDRIAPVTEPRDFKYPPAP